VIGGAARGPLRGPAARFGGRGARPLWTPAELILTFGPRMIWNNDEYPLLDEYWQDRSGDGRELVAPAPPATTTIDGKQAVVCTTAGGEFNHTGPYLSYTTNVQSIILAAVVRVDGALPLATQRHVINFDNSAGNAFRWCLQFQTTGEVRAGGRIRDADTAIFTTGTTVCQPGDVQLVVGILRPISDYIAVRINGTLENSDATWQPGGPAINAVASGDLDIGDADMTLCEVVAIYENAANVNGLETLIEGYLAHRWGIAHKLDALHPYKHKAPRR